MTEMQEKYANNRQSDLNEVKQQILLRHELAERNMKNPADKFMNNLRM